MPYPPTSGRYGITAFGEDRKVSFHSNYSSVVYAGQMSTTTSAAQPTYTGDNHIALTSAIRASNYHMGRIIQYEMTLDVDFFIPFYCPNHNNQEICIMDVLNEGTKWVVNLLFSGTSSQAPTVYGFAPLNELPSSMVTLNDNGIAVYDSNSNLIFTDSKRPLRVDEALEIEWPQSNDMIDPNVAGQYGAPIRVASKGSVAYNAGGTHPNAGNGMHVNFTPDRTKTYTSSATNSSNKLYSIVPTAYGGLAYESSDEGHNNCDFGLIRPYAWAYKSWASFRGCMRHPRNSTNQVTCWRADFAGAAYEFQQASDCQFSGVLGAIIGFIIGVFTGGTALTVIGAVLAGFAIAELTITTTPSIKAYDQDETFNNTGDSEAVLMITDKSYYGIS